MNWEKSHNIEPIQKWKGNIVTYVYKNKKKHGGQFRWWFTLENGGNIILLLCSIQAFLEAIVCMK